MRRFEGKRACVVGCGGRDGDPRASAEGARVAACDRDGQATRSGRRLRARPSSSSGQGASLAIESAIELARALRDMPYPEAFAAYEKLRRPRVEMVIAATNRKNSAKAPVRCCARSTPGPSGSSPGSPCPTRWPGYSTTTSTGTRPGELNSPGLSPTTSSAGAPDQGNAKQFDPGCASGVDQGHIASGTLVVDGARAHHAPPAAGHGAEPM